MTETPLIKSNWLYFFFEDQSNQFFKFIHFQNLICLLRHYAPMHLNTVHNSRSRLIKGGVFPRPRSHCNAAIIDPFYLCSLSFVLCNRKMKRPRPTQLFSGSDSDSDVVPTRSRFKPSPSPSTHPPNDAARTSTDQPDSLDAFMSSLQSTTTAPCPKASAQQKSPHPATFTSSDDEDEKPTISEMRDHASDCEQTASRRNPDQPQLNLPPIDYSLQPGPPVQHLKFSAPSHLETDSEVIASQLSALRANVHNGIAPIIPSFQDISPPAPENLVHLLSMAFPDPTPVQAITFPFTFCQRDLVAVAQTGSGKTLAYAVPLLCHVAAQSGSSRSGRGPAGLVIVPTRELALQITEVLGEYGKHVGASACCVVGGVPKYEQHKQVRDGGAAIIVCTPGRLIDILRLRACRMSRCSFVVLDEADRMLDMGFGPQVRTVLSQIRPDAQRAFFSATMPTFVKRLAADFLNNPVHVSLTGANGRRAPAMVNENVTDCFLCFDSDNDRKQWLLDNLARFVQTGLVIVFCTTRGDSAALANIIRGIGMPAACIHGETEQLDREGLLRMFRAGELPLLVTTDLSARGLDIDDVHSVVNYGCAKSWEWHVHRVGRTGRAARKGNAYTLMDCNSRADVSFAVEAVAILRKDNRDIPSALSKLLSSQDTTRESQSRMRGRRPKK